MATLTITSSIKSKRDISADIDLISYGYCRHCNQLPRVYQIEWGRKNTGQVTECCGEADGWLDNWKRRNGTPQLRDRADGVKGHFCIGRVRELGACDTWEFWNDTWQSWASAGTVYMEQAAKVRLVELIEKQKDV